MSKLKVKVRGLGLVPLFEYVFMLVMVVYMAQMTAATSRMMGSLGSPFLPFLLPIVLIAILYSRHPVSFKDRRLLILLGVLALWCVLSLVKIGGVATEDISFMFFIFYAMVVAYLMVRIFGKSLFVLYEDIMAKFCLITLAFWLFSILLPSVAETLFSIFPETPNGRNVLFIYHWMDPESVGMLGESYFLRNAGISWEPGRFAIMVILALLVNLSRNGLRFVKGRNILTSNPRLILFFATICSTISTTGVIVALVLVVIFLLKNLTRQRLIVFAVVLIPIMVFVGTRNFVMGKIVKQLDSETVMQDLEKLADWFSLTTDDSEYGFSLDRLPSLYFEGLNVVHSPLLGYTTNSKHSYFYEFSPNIVLCGGLIKVFGQFGLLLGLFFYWILWKSSVAMSRIFPYAGKFTLMLTILLCAISYQVFLVPVYTAVWFYGYFEKKKDAVEP